MMNSVRNTCFDYEHRDIYYIVQMEKVLYCIPVYQLFFSYGPQVAPSFYQTKKGGAEAQTVVPLPATAFYCITYSRCLVFVLICVIVYITGILDDAIDFGCWLLQFRFCYATINAAYNQRIIQSTPLYTAWIKHQIWGQYMCSAPERLSAFGARTFSTVTTTSVVQDLNKKSLALIVWCVDYMLRCTYRSSTLIAYFKNSKSSPSLFNVWYWTNRNMVDFFIVDG
jgi:hypothetical protein